MKSNSIVFLLLSISSIHGETYIRIHNNTPYTFHIATNTSGIESELVTCELDATTIKPLQTKQVVWVDEQTIKKGQEFTLDVMLRNNNQDLSCRQLFRTDKKTSVDYAIMENQESNPVWYNDSKQYQTAVKIADKSLLVFSRKLHNNYKNTVLEYTIQENRHPTLHKEPDHLKILSWNVDMKPHNYIKNGQYQRALLVSEYVKGYDVVVLTELFDPSALRIIYERLKDEYPYNSITTHKATRTNHYKDGKCIAFFSKWPLEGCDYQLFNKLCSGYDCHFKKGIAYTCVNKQGHRYHLFGASLQDWPSNRAALVRYEQLKKIKEMINERAISLQEPVIIAGSFYINKYKSSFDDRKRSEYQEMLSMLGTDLGQHEGYTFTVDPSINSMARTIDPKEYSDYIMYLTIHKKPKKFMQEVCIFKTTVPWQERFKQPTCDLSSHFAVCGTLEF